MRRTSRTNRFIALILIVLASCAKYKDPKAPVADRVADLMKRMTLEEKIGQMAQVEWTSLQKQDDIAAYALGSILAGGDSEPSDSSPLKWADLIDGLQKKALSSRLGIPILFGLDAVHGNNNVAGAVIFPHNIGMGATRSTELVRKAARITAEEMLAIGARWNFAPCIAVPLSIFWGRTYEGFGEDPTLVGEMGAAAIQGYQEGGLGAPGTVLATAKHFAADGGTIGGIDRGDAMITEKELRTVFIAPYKNAIAAGAMSIMVSYSSINGMKNHGSRELLTGILRDELGFSGIVISDMGGVKELPGSPEEQIKTAVNAGMDVLMLPSDYPGFKTAMLDLAKSGGVSAERVDEAVRRILTVKLTMGLFEHPFADRSLLTSMGSAEHRQTAREAVQASLVLLKNARSVLPIGPSVTRILVSGSLADDLGGQCGGWTISWQGSRGPITQGTTILEGIRQVAGPDTAVVTSEDGTLPGGENPVDLVVLVLGETPYAEMRGDRYDLPLPARDRKAITEAKKLGAPIVVVLISGRPLFVASEISKVDAFVAAWLPGTEGEGVADVLFGKAPFTGKLPVSWPRDLSGIPTGSAPPLFPYGAGLTY